MMAVGERHCAGFLYRPELRLGCAARSAGGGQSTIVVNLRRFVCRSAGGQDTVQGAQGYQVL